MKQIKRILLRYIVRDLLKGVSIEDLLRNENGKMYIGYRELNQDEILRLKGEASTFKKSLLWSLMSNNVYWIANFKMMREADREGEMDMGRSMTLVIDTLRQFIDKLE